MNTRLSLLQPTDSASINGDPGDIGDAHPILDALGESCGLLIGGGLAGGSVPLPSLSSLAFSFSAFSFLSTPKICCTISISTHAVPALNDTDIGRLSASTLKLRAVLWGTRLASER